MTFRNIRRVQQEVWPTVQESLDIIRAQRDAVAKDLRGASTAAKSRARLPWNRVVANEAVWAIAKADLLSTPEHAAVVQAAREWLHDMGPEMAEYPEEFGKPDFALRDAVQTLATTFNNFPDDE